VAATGFLCAYISNLITFIEILVTPVKSGRGGDERYEWLQREMAERCHEEGF
jgi:hypothetical protein